MNDIFNGCVRTLDNAGSRVVDFRAYVQDVLTDLKAQQEAENAKEIKTPGGIIAQPSQDDTVVFGGGE